MNLLIQSTNTTSLPVLMALTLACFALLPHARADCQDACLTNANTVQGDDALISNTTGSVNTAIGSHALFSNVTGLGNTAIGEGTLYNNTGAPFIEGSFNTATGLTALFDNTTGSFNTAIGSQALFSNTTGNSNIAVGLSAGANLTTGASNIDIGNLGRAGESGNIRIGTKGAQTKAFIAGISGVTVPTGVGVIIDTNGHLGTVVSSSRYKEAVKSMDKASEAILGLRPVTFRYKKELDPDRIPQFGLVAEDVAKVDPELVAHDDEGKPYAVRYEALNAMLLNEFLKEHRKVEEQQTAIIELKKALTKQQEQLESLTSALRRVNDQLASQTSPQLTVNN